MTPIKAHDYWVPVRLSSIGFIRVSAFSEEEALQMVDNQQFNPDEAVGQEIDDVEITGPPVKQEVQ